MLIILLQNGEPIQNDEQPVNGLQIIIGNNTQVKYKNRVWTFLNGTWIKE